MSKIGYRETKRWYEENASKYAQKTGVNSSIHKLQIVEFCSLIPAGGSVLDAGCGSGKDTEWFRKHGYEVVGMDASPNMVSEAKKLYPQAKFKVGDILNMPFDDSEFDAVWARAAIVHFDDDKQIEIALSNFFRVLKPGGVLHVLVRFRKEKAQKEEVLKDSIAGDFRYYRNFDSDELREFLEGAGFLISELNHYRESDLDENKRPGEGIEWLVVTAAKPE